MRRVRVCMALRTCVLAEHNLETLSFGQSWNGPATTPAEATTGPALRSLATPMRGEDGR